MKVGELFLDIALEGGEKVSDALSRVKGWLTDVSAQGIAAKAAILGTLYALERITSAAGQFGNSLTNLSVLTGVDTTKIQQWSQYMIAGGSAAEDAYAAIKASAEVQADIQHGQTPEGLGRIGQQIHKNLFQHLDDPLYLMDAAKEYLRTTSDSIAIANRAVRSLHLSEGFITGVRQNPEDVYSITRNVDAPGTILSLKQVQREYAQMEKQWGHLRDIMTAKFGLPIIKELEMVIKKIDEITTKTTNWMSVMDRPTQLTSYLTGTGSYSTGSGKTDAAGDFGNFLYDLGTGKLGKPSDWIHMLEPKGEKGLLPRLLEGNFSQGKPHAENNTNIVIHQNGIEDTHGSVTAMRDDVARAWASISTREMVA